MEFSIQSLAGDHREIDAALDCFAERVAAGAIDPDAFRQARQLCLRHYEREEAFLAHLRGRDAALAAKLKSQHEEAIELAAGVEEAISADQFPDALYLARRFLAIARHNIIEEERDVFPFAGA